MGSEIYFLFFTMRFWWKVSLAIVFSELTCINVDCSILGKQRGGQGKLTSMFLDSLLLNSITINFFFVWYPRTRQKRATKTTKRAKKYKQLPFLFTEVQPGVQEYKNIFIKGKGLSAWKASLECFLDNGVRAIKSDRR